MINLSRICVASLQKPPIVLAFSMIWSKSSDFHQVHDFPIHHFDQVHDSLFQMTVFEIDHTDEKFSCMPADACEIDTQMMIVWLILIKSSIHHLLIFIKSTILKSDFHHVHDPQVWFSSSSRPSSLIFTKFISQIARWPFSKFVILTKFFYPRQQMHAKTTLTRDRRYYREMNCDSSADVINLMLIDLMLIDDWMLIGFDAHRWLKAHRVWCSSMIECSPIWCSSMIECSSIWCPPMIECSPCLMFTDDWMLIDDFDSWEISILKSHMSEQYW